tara:strand:+ start:55 stop:1068 length:1014 start_codon:yes stop_codon:yes gene_type:complete
MNAYQLKINKPLLIYGLPGSGKTHLAEILLKDSVLLKIDAANLKNIDDLKEYILNKIKKINITLMFSKKKSTHGILIDDIHIFNNYDKKNFKHIINFIRDNKFYNSKIVLVCNKSFIKNKELIRLKINKLECKYSYSDYYKICLQISKSINNKICLDSLDRKIYDSKYNFNIFLSKCNDFKDTFKDNYDGNEIITQNILSNKYSLSDIFRYCEGEEKIIFYNLIENISKSYLELYNYISLFNRNDIMLDNFHLLNIPIMKINYCNNKNNKKIIYNKYISKKMISFKNNLEINNYFIYLIDTYDKIKNDKYLNNIDKIDKKVLKYHNSVYNSFKELYQ